MIDNRNETLSEQLTDLQQCEKEPLNYIGSVQSHGCFISFTVPDRRIQAVSENIGEIFGKPQSQVLSAKLDHIFSSAFADTLVQYTLEVADSPGYSVALSYEEGSRSFDLLLYASEGLFCLEIQRAHPEENSPKDRFEANLILRDRMIELRNSTQLQEMGDIVCRGIRAITGMDRVMLYRFLPPHWHGEVIAEARAVHAHSFYKHRFPASDIPRIARELYLRNGIRSIPDVTAPISKIVPGINPKTKAAIDLTDSRIRAVSPIHLEYLRNMKIGASYSFAIVSQGELWGLIACHHLSPLLISAAKLGACELLANALGAQAPLLESVRSQQERISFELKLRKVVDFVSYSQDPVGDLMKNHMSLLESFKATGVAVVTDKGVDFAGLCPTAQQLREIADSINQKMKTENKNIFAFQSLALEFPKWEGISHAASGVLAASISGIDNGLLLFFRPEQIETIVWGGDPRKQLDKKNFTGRIHPRASFDAWEETIRLHSIEWSKFEVEGIEFLKNLVFETLAPKQKLLHELSTNRSK